MVLFLSSLLFLVCCGRGQMTLPPGVAVRYDGGTRLLMQGRYDEAITAYREVVRSVPAYAPAHKNLGLAYALKGNADVAIRAYQEAIRLHPDDAAIHNDLGTVYLVLKHDHPRAEKAYKMALRLNPGEFLFHYNLGGLYVAMGRYNEAATAFEEVLHLSPENPLGHYSLGVLNLRRGRYDDAVKAYTKAITLNPSQKEAHYELGLTYAKLGDLDAAISSYGRALSLDPDYWSARYGLGTAYIRSGRLEEGKRELERFQKAGQPVGNVEIKYIFFSNPDALHPGPGPSSTADVRPAEAAYHRGIAAMNAGNYDKAISALLEALRLDPELIVAMGALGDLYHTRGHLDDAAGAYNEILSRAPDSEAALRAYGGLAVIAEQRGQIDSAVTAYRAIITLRPDLASGYRDLARLYASFDLHLDEALTLARHALTLAPGSDTYGVLAWVEYKRGQYKEARKAARRAIDLGGGPIYAQLLTDIDRASQMKGKSR